MIFSGIENRSGLKKSIITLLMASASASLFGYTSGDGSSGNPYIITSADTGLSGGYYFEATSNITSTSVIKLSNSASPETNTLYVRTSGTTFTNGGMRISYLDGNTAYVYVSNGATIDAGSTGAITTGFRGTGTLDISGATVKGGASASFIGYSTNSNGTVNVKSGSTYSNLGTLSLGYNSSATGHLNVDGAGSTTSSTALVVGETGAGTASLTNGGAYTSTSSLSYVGKNAGSSGTMTVSSGSHWNNAGLTIASAASSTGSLSIDGTGSYFSDSSTLNIGPGGAGTLTITDGALAAVASTLTTGTNGFIQLNGGFFALKSASLLTPSDITSTYHFQVYSGGSYVTGTASNIQTEYFSTSTDWQNSALYSTYSSLDLTGYTLVYEGAVPEPATVAFLGGFAALGFVALSKRRK